MEAFIHFLIQYNEKIIYISGGAICLLSVMVVWWQVFGKKGLKTGAADFDFSEIEESLKKILSQTHAAIGNVTASATSTASPTETTAAPSPAPLSGIASLDGKPITDVEGVKKELEERAKLIENLNAQVVAAKKQDASAELLAKIKDLEGRLAEYEIIEDDIADLSLFKEENAKLKKEIETLKRAGPQMVDQFAEALAQTETKTSGASRPSGSIHAVESGTASAADFAADTVAQSNVTASAAATPAGAASTFPNQPMTDATPISVEEASAALNALKLTEDVTTAVDAAGTDFPAEQAASVDEAIAKAGPLDTLAAEIANAAPATENTTPATENAATLSEPSAVSASPEPSPAIGPLDSPPAAKPAVPSPPPPAEAEGDIFAEFAHDGTQEEDPLAALGDIDPDRMLDELKGLNAELGAETLEEVPDIDKMAQEAVSLSTKKG